MTEVARMDIPFLDRSASAERCKGDAGLLTPPLAITAVPLALHSSKGRMCLLGSSPEVVLPAAHTSPEQVGGDVEVVPPPLRRNSSAVRKLQELDAEEGLGHLSPFSLILCGLSSASPVKM